MHPRPLAVALLTLTIFAAPRPAAAQDAPAPADPQAPQPAPVAPADAAPAPPPARPAVVRPAAPTRVVVETPAEPDEAERTRTGVVVGVHVSGLQAVAPVGGVLVGFRDRWGTFGLTFDLSRSSSALTDDSNDEIDLSHTQLAIGLVGDFVVARALASKLEILFGADARFLSVSQDASGFFRNSDNFSSSATGFALAAGPAARLWLADRVALGYSLRYGVTHLSGPLPVLTSDVQASAGSTSLDGLSSASVSVTQLGFTGALELLAVF